MKGRDKLILAVLIVTFIATAGMFYYQNVYMKKQDESNKVMVLVAKKDIAEGTEFNPENIGAIRLDKNMVLGTYVTKFEDLKGKVAGQLILTNEIVTTPRIQTDKDGTKQFVVGLEAKQMPTSIKKDDNVRVYVKVDQTVYELFKKKVVTTVNYKKSSSGKDTDTIETVDMLMSDEEAVTYYQAKDSGDIIVIRYHDLTEKDLISSPKFNVNQVKPAVKDAKATATVPVASQTTAQSVVSTPQVQLYVAKAGETFDTIAKQFNVTTDELKAQNPGVSTLAPGDMLTVKKG